MSQLKGGFTAVLLVVVLLRGAAAVQLEDFLGGRPLSRERVVRDVLEYYQRQDPMGIPVLEIPEPLILPNNMTVSMVALHGLQITGLSGLRLEYVNVNVTSLMASVLVRIPRVELLSVYTYSSYWSSTVGDMNITFVGLDVKVELQLGADRDARLQVDNLEVTILKEGFYPILTNKTIELSLAVSAADSFFDTIVSGAVGSRTEGAREKINARLADRLQDKRFPEGINPIDLLVAGVKSDIRHKFDPLMIGNKTVALPAGSVLLATNIEVSGLSSLHRTHEVSLQLVDDRLLLVLQVGSQQISACADVELSVPILPSIVTRLEFSIASVSVWVEAQQSADVRHPPQLRRINITLGNFRLRSGGESSLSYLLEGAVNALPNALRNTITARVAPRLQQVIQKRLNSLDVEEIIEKRLEKMKREKMMAAQ